MLTLRQTTLGEESLKYIFFIFCFVKTGTKDPHFGRSCFGPTRYFIYPLGVQLNKLVLGVVSETLVGKQHSADIYRIFH